MWIEQKTKEINVLKQTTIAMAIVIGLGTCVLAADKDMKPADAEAAIQKGLQLYKEGQAGAAIAALQEAIGIIQKSQQKGLAAFFPKAPDGWEAGKLETNSAASGSGKDSFTLTALEQDFTRKSDSLKVRISLTNSPQLIEPQKAMLENFRKNPMILQTINQAGEQKMTMISRDGWEGWQNSIKDGNGEIIAFNGSNMLNIHMDKFDQSVLDQFWNAIDLKGLAGQSASKPAK